MNGLNTLQQLVDLSQRIVFFGGAGVSTESGIPDFRSQDGLYNQQYDYPPEMILSRSFFQAEPFEFYRFYRDKVLALSARPNAAHLKLAELEAAGKLLAVVTQNIDGLHQQAGSKQVWELHGSVWRNHCTKCRKAFAPEYIVAAAEVPLCDTCGAIIEPDVVLYEDGLDSDVIAGAVAAIRAADMLIIGGTSLVVYPAAGLVRHFTGERLAVLNMDGTGSNLRDALLIREPIAKVLKQLVVR
ncbi:MAG: NAD-dependent protein deacylase [Propionibacteriaceae bacterium]|jgi:NAD-dependent deacetylase|nr:NAD-dependent protein deacylase [Propionibacteriaceae bacterium]